MVIRHDVVTVLAVAALTVACSSRRDAKAKAGDEHARATEPADAPAVDIEVDGKRVARVASSAVTARKPLVDWLPAGLRDRTTWLRVEARAGLRTLSLDQRTFAAYTIDLYPDAGELTLGVFRPVPDRAPAHVQQRLAEAHVALRGVRGIQIVTPVAPQAATADELYPDLPIAIAGRPIAAVSNAQMMKLPPTGEFSERRAGEQGHQQSWHLADVLRPLVELDAIEAITVHAGNAQVALDGATLRADDRRPLLKRNRKGELIYRLHLRGARGPLQEARGVTRLDVTLKP